MTMAAVAAGAEAAAPQTGACLSTAPALSLLFIMLLSMLTTVVNAGSGTRGRVLISVSDKAGLSELAKVRCCLILCGLSALTAAEHRF